MSFIETVERARALLERNRRLSVRALKREFDLADDVLEELIEELVDVQHVATREGEVLAWVEQAGFEPPATQAEAPPATAPEGQAASRAAAPQAAEAERRHLTVMFCDLVGSTELSQRLDTEALSEVVAAYQQTCAASIEGFDGHIAQYLGDGVLVYFGYPLAHEDDAMRAIHAALRIREEVPELNRTLAEEHAWLREHPLQIRVGIHTGSVIVGDMGGGQTRERLALGDTVNIAARIEQEAEPGSIIVSDATRDLVRGAFVFKELGKCLLKGIEEPVALFRPVQATGVQSRLALAGASGLTPLVGREQEVGLLLERWEEAKAGRGQVVLLSGEAGMGKSRMIEMLREHVAEEPHTWHEYRGSAYHQNSTFHPVIELIERAVMFTETDTPEERLSKLERGLSYSGLPAEETLLLVADFLGLPSPENSLPLTLSPEARRRRTLEALAVWPVALCQRQPVIMIAEDLHWWDASSLEGCGMAVEQVPAAPILLVATFRPEFEPPWPNASRWTHLRLQALTGKHVEEMARHFTGGKSLPREVRNQIVYRTDGVPLFVEELTKTVLESGLVIESDGQYERTDTLPSSAIPTTLRDSLTARLDRLGPAKEVAQLASVLGREFSYDLLRAVSPLDPDSLDRALRELVAAELLYQRGIPPHATYIFKHALIQDAAQQSLLKTRRREVHARTAAVLEEAASEGARVDPEMLARHFEAAGFEDRAAEHFSHAGEQAAARSAHREAIAHLRRALVLLEKLPENQERFERELAAQTALGVSLQATEGYTSGDARVAYERARELCDVVEDPDRLAFNLWGLASMHQTRGELDVASELSERLCAHARASGERLHRFMGHQILGNVLLCCGKSAARDQLEQAIAVYDASLSPLLVAGIGQDTGMTARVYHAWMLWVCGEIDAAGAEGRAAVEAARTLGHPFTLAFIGSFGGVVFGMRREWNRCGAYAEEVMQVSQTHGFPLWSGVGRVLQGWSRRGAVEEVQEGMALAGQTGNQALVPLMLGILADTYRAAGRDAEAVSAADLGLTVGESTKQHFWRPEILRNKGEAFLQLEDHTHEEAESLFRDAIEIARSQEAKSLELRAATSLALLWRDQGKPAEARNVLAPVYDWFSEGFDTQDLKDAKALLGELA